jgi:hypothetical protein
MKRLFLAAFVCALAPAIAQAADVRMIGLDEDGKSVEVVVPKNEYTNRLTHLLGAARDSAAPVLSEVAARNRDAATSGSGNGGAASGAPAAGADSQNPWILRTVVVGMGVSGTIGLGPIIQLTATPRFRVGFTNSSDVAIP